MPSPQEPHSKRHAKDKIENQQGEKKTCEYAHVYIYKVKSLSRVRLFVTPWTITYQAPLSMGFSRQEYWSGLPFPSPEDLPDSGIEPGSPVPPALAGGFLMTSTTWEAKCRLSSDPSLVSG